MGSKESKSYKYILEEFGEEKVKQRFEYLYNYLMTYIEVKGYSRSVSVCANLLDQAVLDYFVDIKRLKDMHGIEKINDIKIRSYTAYWLWRRRPLQILSSADTEQDYDLIFVNERFVTEFLFSFLTKDQKLRIKDEDEQKIFLDFLDNILYTMKYRLVTAQKIESILEGFNAGRVVEKSVNEVDE